MNTERLIIMANQIGDFFCSHPDAGQAKTDIANHLKRFWALSMRKQIVAHVHEKHGVGLDPIVGDAIKENQSILI
ncbi:MAG TPA: formate dehydrogenase subunit delta [Methylophilaceae bacterium]|jgi:formate dehydrogenase subunit delta